MNRLLPAPVSGEEESIANPSIGASAEPARPATMSARPAKVAAADPVHTVVACRNQRARDRRRSRMRRSSTAKPMWPEPSSCSARMSSAMFIDARHEHHRARAGQRVCGPAAPAGRDRPPPSVEAGTGSASAGGGREGADVTPQSVAAGRQRSRRWRRSGPMTTSGPASSSSPAAQAGPSRNPRSRSMPYRALAAVRFASRTSDGSSAAVAGRKSALPRAGGERQREHRHDAVG